MSTALKNKKVRVMPVTRNGGWLKPGHDGHFMYTGVDATFCVPIRQDNGKLVDPLKDFNEEEKRELAKNLAVDVDSFNIFNKNNYWLGKEVKLDKNSEILDLKDPGDVVKYVILKANEDSIAPSFSSRFDKGTYRFCLSDLEEETIEKRNKADKKKTAYMAFGKMQVSDTRLKNFFKVYGKRVQSDASIDWMVGQVDSIIENDLDGFLAIVEDPNYEMKLLISEAIDARAIIKKGLEYELPGGESLGNLDETIAKLNNVKYQDVLMTINARIEASKSK